MAVLIVLAWQVDTAKGHVVTAGLISYWSFDRASITGKTAKDVWGDNHGTIFGNPKIVAGKIVEALEFDEGCEDRVDFDDSDMPSGSEERTQSVWIKAPPPWDPAQHAGNNRSVFEYGTGAATQRSAILLLNVPVPQTIKWCGHGADVTSVSAIELDTWTFVTTTYDGTTVRIYINGELDITQEMDIDTKLGIGRIGGNISDHDECYNGIIDEVSIYDRALSDDEVERNFHANGLAVKPAEKLALTWGEIKVSR